MKRLMSLLLACVLLLSATAVLADGESNPVLYREKNRGAAVSKIRDRLYELQYFTGNYYKSDIFSPKVTERVKSFQKKNGLTVTGKVDQTTWDLLFSDKALNAYGVVWNDINNSRVSKQYTLLGDEQFYVGDEGNVIVIILDTYANSYFNELVKKDPKEIKSGLEDFTYYNNYDSKYYGTYPAMAYLLTGYDYTNEVGIGQWFHDAWTSESAKHFYGTMKEMGYDAYFYSTAPHNVGIKSEAMAYFSNLVRNSEYEGTPVGGTIANDIMPVLKKGLTVVPGKRMVIQHLYGMHYPYVLSANGNQVASSNAIRSAEGWLNVAKEYINQLKIAGVYDQSTIIIMADHGTKLATSVQSLFMIKPAGNHGDGLITTNAPTTHEEFIPTVLYCSGAAADDIPGKTVFDYEEDEERERTFYVNANEAAYGKKIKYAGKGTGSHNVWLGYTYTGNYKELNKQMKRGPSVRIEMNQSFN